MRNWKDLTKEEQEEWCEIADRPLSKIFMALVGQTKCIYCSTEFPDGLIKKTPKDNKGTNPFKWFNDDCLVHLKTTHGYTPEIIESFLIALNK
jgi:hypothetical protein